jgi:hypothetical protein
MYDAIRGFVGEIGMNTANKVIREQTGAETLEDYLADHVNNGIRYVRNSMRPTRPRQTPRALGPILPPNVGPAVVAQAWDRAKDRAIFVTPDT